MENIKKKIIENFSHNFDDYECMWNGIEDIYINKTGEKLPSQFFFAMSASFKGLSTPNTNSVLSLFFYIKLKKSVTK